MKKLFKIIAAILCPALLSGCAVYGSLDDKDGMVIPLHDGALAWSFIGSETAGAAFPVNMTKEEADKIFSNIEVFGAKLSLPMKLCDLPTEFSLFSGYNKEYARSIDGRFFAFSDNIVLPDQNGEEEFVASIDIITDGNNEDAFNNGIIVCFGLGILDSDVKINGAGAGDFNYTITEALGEGYLYQTEDSYVIRIYSDGERMIKMTYGSLGESESDDNIKEIVEKSSPMLIDIIAHSEYRTLYSY